MNDDIYLGRWMGRREAFALVAGRCSAAEAESLRHIRDEKLYRTLSQNWDEFCTAYVGVSRRSVERNLALLDEFGPLFFDVSQMVHLGPDEFRAIAADIDAEGVHLDGAVVRLLPENGAEAAAAVNELLRRVPPPPAEEPTFEPVLRSCQSAGRMLADCTVELNPLDQMELAEALVVIRKAAAARGVAW